MDKASERLFALKPVTFRAKANVDPGHVKHYGFIAEDVAEVDSDLVVYNPDGQPETLRFDSINAMLLNEFLKEHKTVQEQQSKIDKEEATIADLRFALAKQKATFAQQQESFAEQKRQIEALASGLQRVTDQVELSRFATGRIRCSGAAPQIIISP